MSQAWNPEVYASDARFVSKLGASVIELLSPKPGERILDLGCGDGALTHKLLAHGCRVVGVDSSADMVGAAVKMGLDARVADGQELAFEDEFDAVLSNAALHWMPRYDDVIAGVHRALKPQGRFVGEFGGHGNIATVVEAIRWALEKRRLDFDALNPWYFPTADEYRTRLEAHSFQVRTCLLVPRPTPLETDLTSWLQVFARTFLDAIPRREHESFLRDVTRQCEAVLRDPTGRWSVDYVRLRFAATKSA